MKKIFMAILVCIILTGCIAVAGCINITIGGQDIPSTVQPTSSAPQATSALPQPTYSTSGDAIWTATEYDDGANVKHIMIFHTDGTGEKKKDKGYKISDLRYFTWTQPDNCHFICRFADGDVDTFTLTSDGRLTHDGKYYESTQKGSLPAVSTPVANPQDHPEIIGIWETYELDKKGIDTKTLEFKADGTGVKSKIKAKGSIESSMFTWVPVGSYYLIMYPATYEAGEDDDTMQIVDGKLDHDGEIFTKV